MNAPYAHAQRARTLEVVITFAEVVMMMNFAAAGRGGAEAKSAQGGL